MWIYLKLAWRNLFRNKRRSLLAGIAIGMGLAALIFVDAMIIGMGNNMIRSATSSFLGEGQIHREGFRETQDVELTINRLDEVLADLQKETIVEHLTLRVMSFAMITSPANLSTISLIGINPSTEQYLSQVDEAIADGNYFAVGEERDIVIGNKLAENLEVTVGDRVVMTVAQSGTGDLSQEMFRISGIFHFNIQEMDQGMAFILLKKAQQMLALGSNVHEIAIKFTDNRYGQDENAVFWDKYSRFNNSAAGWTKILPQLKAALALSQFSVYITALILFGIVALGIINTLFMSLYERMFEFGLLRAVGTRPFRLMQLIILEAGGLAVISIGLGIVLGLAVTCFSSKMGIDYTGIEFAGVTFRQKIYPVLRIRQFINYPFWVFVFTSVVAIYPAVYAAKLNPTEAMRKSL